MLSARGLWYVWRYVFSSFALLSSVTVGGPPALAAGLAERNAEAAALFQAGDMNGAIALEESILRSREGQTGYAQRGASQAMLSYFKWQVGDAESAISYGKEAVKREPRQEQYQFNLGVMALASGDYRTAAAAFQAAAKLAPADCLCQLGLYKAFLLQGANERAYKILDQVAREMNHDYHWYQNLGEVSLQIQELNLADRSLTTAVTLAKTPEQKAISSRLLFICLLRRGEIERAAAIKPAVFRDYSPCEPELFELTASSLVFVGDLVSAEELLATAMTRLNNSRDGDTFFRLGLVFEEKSRYFLDSDPKCMKWLELANEAYRKAIALNTRRAVFHIAIARSLERSGKLGEMCRELSAAQVLDKFDPLSAFLLARMEKISTARQSTEAVSNEQKTAGLKRVSFKIEGPTCDCHVSHLRMALRTNGSVAYQLIPPVQPFGGIVMVDDKIADLDAFFAESVKKAFPRGILLNQVQVPVKVTVLSAEAVPLQTAIDADIRTEAGKLPASVTELSKLTVRMPLSLTASK